MLLCHGRIAHGVIFMEDKGLTQVEFCDLPEKVQRNVERFTRIFDRGVKAAKEENERLGIRVNEQVEYSTIDHAVSLKVSEDDAQK